MQIWHHYDFCFLTCKKKILLIMQDVIPHMAQEYGFEYELITYKWPSWLHKQKEKQRIIWAYKILFLDVIFPLSLEKVLPFLCNKAILLCLIDMSKLICLVYVCRLYLLMLIKLSGQTWEICMT